MWASRRLKRLQDTKRYLGSIVNEGGLKILQCPETGQIWVDADGTEPASVDAATPNRTGTYESGMAAASTEQAQVRNGRGWTAGSKSNAGSLQGEVESVDQTAVLRSPLQYVEPAVDEEEALHLQKLKDYHEMAGMRIPRFQVGSKCEVRDSQQGWQLASIIDSSGTGSFIVSFDAKADASNAVVHEANMRMVFTIGDTCEYKDETGNCLPVLITGRNPDGSYALVIHGNLNSKVLNARAEDLRNISILPVNISDVGHAGAPAQLRCQETAGASFEKLDTHVSEGVRGFLNEVDAAIGAFAVPLGMDILAVANPLPETSRAAASFKELQPEQVVDRPALVPYQGAPFRLGPLSASPRSMTMSGFRGKTHDDRFSSL